MIGESKEKQMWTRNDNLEMVGKLGPMARPRQGSGHKK